MFADGAFSLREIYDPNVLSWIVRTYPYMLPDGLGLLFDLIYVKL